MCWCSNVQLYGCSLKLLQPRLQGFSFEKLGAAPLLISDRKALGAGLEFSDPSAWGGRPACKREGRDAVAVKASRT